VSFYRCFLPFQVFFLFLFLSTTIIALILPLSWKVSRGDNCYFALHGGGFEEKENNAKSLESKYESRADRRRLHWEDKQKQKRGSPRKMAEINSLSVEFYKAINLNQVDKVRNIIRKADLIESGVILNQQIGIYPLLSLHQAIFLGHIDIVQLLLRNNALINQPGPNGLSPLNIAVSAAQIDIVNMLLRNNASVDQPDNQGVSPLRSASQGGNIDIVNILLSKNVSVDQCDDKGFNSLHVAAFNGHIGIVTALLKNNASANLINCNNGYTPLMFATSQIAKNTSEVPIVQLNMVAFELLKNKASMTKLDIGILSKFAIQNLEMGNNSYLEILWKSAELRNSKKVEELRSFEFTQADLDDFYNYDFSAGNDEALDADKFIGLSPTV
jgi:ankyrin repeat protein